MNSTAVRTVESILTFLRT